MRIRPAAALAIASALYAVVNAWSATPNNGDLMYLESLYHHLFELDRPWSEFVFTEASFLFPDGLIYLALRAALGTQAFATAAYVIVNVVVLLWLVTRLYRRVWPRRDALEGATALAFVVLVLGSVHRLNLTLYWPNHHGALLIALLALVQMRPRRFAGLALLWVVTMLMTFSDGVALMQVFVPLMLFRAWRRDVRVAGTYAGGMASGVSLLMIAKTSHVLRVHTATLWPTAGQLIYQFTHLGETVGGWLAETWVFHLTVVGIFMIGRVFPRDRRTSDLPGAFTLAVGVTFATALAMGRVLNVYAFRYVLNYYALSAVGVALYAWPQLTFRLRHACAVFVTIGLLGGISIAAWRGPVFFRHDLSTCVARIVPAGSFGLAGFWPAKFITFTGGPRVDQVGGGGQKYLWMNAESWYRPGARFVVTDDQMTAEVARAWYGAPARWETCSPQNQVLIYPTGLPEPETPADGPD